MSHTSNHITHQQSLIELFQILMFSLDLETTITNLLSQARRSLAIPEMSIALTDGYVFALAEEEGAEYLEKHPVRISSHSAGKGIGGKVLTTGEVVACDDYWNDFSFEHDPELDEQIRKSGRKALLAVPIYSEGKIIGIWWFCKPKVYEWQPAEIEEAKQFTILAGLAIRNAVLFKQLEDRNKEISALQNISQNFYRQTDLKTLADSAVTILIELIGVDASALRIYDDHQTTLLTLIARQGFDLEKHATPQTLKFGDWLSFIALKKGTPLIIEDLYQFALTYNYPNIEGFVSNYCSTMVMPLFVDNAIVGTITLASKEYKQYSPEQVRFAEVVAQQIGLAVRQLHRIELNQEQDRFNALITMSKQVAHEMSQPLTVLQAELDLITVMGEVPSAETFERMQKAISALTAQVRHHQKMIGDVAICKDVLPEHNRLVAPGK
jgi:GAF domain-containing protein